MGSLRRLIARIRRAAPLEDPPGEWQIDLQTIVRKVSETGRLLSSTIGNLNRVKEMVEFHIARKAIEDAIKDGQEVTQIDNLAETDLSYRWLAASTTEFGRLIGGKKSISHPQDVAMLGEAEDALERLQSWRLPLWRAQQPQGKRDQRPRGNSPHADPAIMALSEGDRRRETSRARDQSRPGARAPLARRMSNDENDDSEDEGSWGARGAVQDPAERSYKPGQSLSSQCAQAAAEV
jgi:hypothetical protein